MTVMAPAWACCFMFSSLNMQCVYLDNCIPDPAFCRKDCTPEPDQYEDLLGLDAVTTAAQLVESLQKNLEAFPRASECTDRVRAFWVPLCYCLCATCLCTVT